MWNLSGCWDGKGKDRVVIYDSLTLLSMKRKEIRKSCSENSYFLLGLRATTTLPFFKKKKTRKKNLSFVFCFCFLFSSFFLFLLLLLEMIQHGLALFAWQGKGTSMCVLIECEKQRVPCVCAARIRVADNWPTVTLLAAGVPVSSVRPSAAAAAPVHTINL